MTAAPPGRFLSFDAVAADYDATRVVPEAQRREVARLCASAAGLERGGRFLDAGVGTGRFAAPLAERHPGQIVGADISTAMLARAREKAGPEELTLTVADLQRLPFADGAFAGALTVHILHLIEGWRTVLGELRRVLRPGGALLLGAEQGGRSAMIEHYYERARALEVLPAPLGAGGLTQAVSHLQSPAGGQATVDTLRAPRLRWKRSAVVRETLDALARRTYSQTWTIPDDAHQRLLAEAEEFARAAFGSLNAVETLDARFALHVARWR